MISDLTQHRRAFWRYFVESVPTLAERTVRGNESSRWLAVGPRPLIIAHYIATGSVGLFVRGAARERIGHVREYLFPHRRFLAESLGKPDLRLGRTFLVPDICRLDMNDRANWPQAIDWFSEHSSRYEGVFAALQTMPEPWPDEPPDFHAGNP
jgi:hypothetical protein